MKKILMLHGINHNMFGQRDPAQYGTVTLAEIDASLRSLGSQLGCEVDSFQTNCEGALCDRIHQGYRDGVDGVLINAGAWTHYMSNIHAREPFRHHSVFAEIAKGQICGFGADSYLLGLRAVLSAIA
jgi:3-dehydroquinate dehydratase-2